MSQLFKHTGDYYSYLFASHLKASMSMLLYAKVSKITLFMVRSSDTGMITNLLSSDLTAIENRMQTLLNSIAFPLLFIGVTVICLFRVGWPGIMALITIAVQLIIGNLISRKNKKIVIEGNKYKDKRVEITTELI